MDLVEASLYHERTLERLNRSPATLRLYKLYQGSFMAFLVEHQVELTLDALNPQFVREWQQWLRGKSTGKRGGIVERKAGRDDPQDLGPLPVRERRPRLRPAGSPKNTQSPADPAQPFTQDEATRLVQAASGGANPIRDRALLLLMLDTGCRVGELCAAAVDDVDLVEGQITFRRTKNGSPRTVVFGCRTVVTAGPALPR